MTTATGSRAFHVEQGSRVASQASPQAGALGESGTGAVLAVVNQKGGVGKTTTAISLATALGQAGERVLLVDLDPQANATSGLGVSVAEHQATTYEVLVEGEPIAAAALPTTGGGGAVDLVPSTIDLVGAELHLVGAMSRERRLARAVSSVRGQYAIILIDCPPSLGLLTVNALSAADSLIVPIQCEYYALEGLGALQGNVQLVREELNPGLHVLGYVLTMYDGRTRLSAQVEADVRRHFGEEVFSTRIPRSVRLAEAPSYGQSITAFDPSSRGAVAYHRLAHEIIARLRAE